MLMLEVYSIKDSSFAPFDGMNDDKVLLQDDDKRRRKGDQADVPFLLPFGLAPTVTL